MISEILGRKLGMTQVYDAQNTLVPVTVVEAGPCSVVQVKTVETDGYNAVQIGFSTKKSKNSSAAELAHAKKANLDINPDDGAALEQSVKDILKLDSDLVAKLKEILK